MLNALCQKGNEFILKSNSLLERLITNLPIEGKIVNKLFEMTIAIPFALRYVNLTFKYIELSEIFFEGSSANLSIQHAGFEYTYTCTVKLVSTILLKLTFPNSGERVDCMIHYFALTLK